MSEQKKNLTIFKYYIIFQSMNVLSFFSHSPNVLIMFLFSEALTSWDLSNPGETAFPGLAYS